MLSEAQIAFVLAQAEDVRSLRRDAWQALSAGSLAAAAALTIMP